MGTREREDISLGNPWGGHQAPVVTTHLERPKRLRRCWCESLCKATILDTYILGLHMVTEKLCAFHGCILVDVVTVLLLHTGACKIVNLFATKGQDPNKLNLS